MSYNSLYMSHRDVLSGLYNFTQSGQKDGGCTFYHNSSRIGVLASRLAVGVLVFRSSGPRLSPDRTLGCVLRQANLLSQCISPCRCINGYGKFNAGGNPPMAYPIGAGE